MFAANTQLETAHLQGLDMAYALRPGGPDCILFLHGLGCSKVSFDAAFNGRYFGESYTLLAPDCIGHGGSARAGDFSYTLERQAELLLALLTELSIDRVAIVAHSMGNVPGLLLSGKVQSLFGYFCLEGNLCEADCNVSARVARYSEEDFVNKLHPMAPKQFLCRGRDDEIAASPVAYHRSASSLVAWSGSGKLLPMYQEIQVPKVYFHGDQSKPVECLDQLNADQVIKVADTGHFLMNDKPAEVYGTIANRLTTP